MLRKINEEQQEWLRANYARFLNTEIAEALGVTVKYVREIHKKICPDVEKLPEVIAAERAIRLMQHRENGRHPNSLRAMKEHCWRGGRPGKQSAEEINKRREVVAQLRKRERARYIWGLPMQTKFRFGKLPSDAAACRHRLKKRGYITERFNRYTMWYDENTQRSERLEQRAATRHKFRFLPREPQTVTDAPQSTQVVGAVS